MSILVTGGAGYIGSVTVERLEESGERVVVLDDLSKGHRAAVDPEIPFYCGRTCDTALVARIVAEHCIDACIHFAALIEAGESVREPARYFANNSAHSMALVNALVENGVRRLVFSSSAAVYGQPKESPVPEEHPQWPVNPYGWSKFFVERMLESYGRAYDLRFVALRYFNAAGATARHGEHHEPESHLIPNVLAVATSARDFVSIFGQDYPTPDSTAIRDYIHVADLAQAHLKALEYLRGGGTSAAINLGNGQGYSVLDVVETARRVTGRPIAISMEARRPGDPARLVANAARARAVLGWQPVFPQLESIIGSAWEWRLAHPGGYETSI